MSNSIFQINALINPKNDDHFKMNVIYLCITLTCIILISCSFLTIFKRKSNCLNWCSLSILAFRQGIRVFDFEHTKEMYENIADWYFLVIGQITANATCIMMMFICFEGSHFRTFVGFFQVIFSFVLFLVGTYDVTYIFDSFLKNSGLILLGSVIWMY